MSTRSSISCGRFERGTYLGAIGVLAFLAIPLATYALSAEEIVEMAKAGNGTVVETHSSASTGGQTARSGERVTTGDSSVSSHTQTIINADGSGGTVEVKVEKTVNGETTKEEHIEDIPAGAPVYVKVEAHADSAEPTAEADEASDVEVHIETEAKKQNFFTDTMPHFFRKVISFFIWF